MASTAICRPTPRGPNVATLRATFGCGFGCTRGPAGNQPISSSSGRRPIERRVRCRHEPTHSYRTDRAEPRLSLDAIDDQHEGVVQGSLDVAPTGPRGRHGMGVIASEYFVTKQSRRTLQRADLARVKHEVAGSPGGVANSNEFNRVAGVDEQPARLTVVLSREGDRLPDRRLQFNCLRRSFRRPPPHLTALTPCQRPAVERPACTDARP